MPWAGFEPAIPMLERPKTALALDRVTFETGPNSAHTQKMKHNITTEQTWSLWNR
jgi:hypothetical protein